MPLQPALQAYRITPAPRALEHLALTFVSQSWEQLEETPQNVVIVVISLQQQHLRMTTFFGAKSDLKQLLSPSSLGNDDVVNFDATPSVRKASGHPGTFHHTDWSTSQQHAWRFAGIAEDRPPPRLRPAASTDLP